MTARQARILELTASGLIDKEIATELGIAHRTVLSHLEAMRAGTGLRKAALVAAWLLSEDCTEAERARVRARLAGAVA